MSFHSAIQLTPELVFIIFVLFIFLVSRAVKVFIKVLTVASVAFIFPWVMQYVGIDIGYASTTENEILFAALGAGIFLFYEFLHVFIAAARIITWPIRWILRVQKEGEIQKTIKRMKDIEKEKHGQ